jgi:hypothetical protein
MTALATAGMPTGCVGNDRFSIHTFTAHLSA